MTADAGSRARVSLGLALLAGAVYAVLSSSAPGWGDSADLARRAVLEPLRPYGRSYPLQSALIRAVDALVRDPARSASLVSSLVAGAGVGLLHWTCRRLLGLSATAALAAAGAWSVHHVVWSSAVDGEVYALLGTTAIACVAAIVAARNGGSGAWTCGLLAGLALLHHRASLFVVPVVLAAPVVLAPADARRGVARRVLLGALAGAIPFLALVVAEVARSGRAVDGDLLGGLLFGTPRNATLLLESSRPFGTALAHAARWTLFCLPGPLLALAPFGAARVARLDRRLGWLLGAVFALALLLPLRMDEVGDRHVFLVTAHVVLVVAGAAALDAPRWRARPRVAALVALAAVAVPPAAYATLARSGARPSRLGELTPAAARAVLLPVRTGDPGSRDWVRAVAPALSGATRVFAEWGAAAALDYARDVDGVAALRGVRVVRRMPAESEIRAAGAGGVLVALTPIWADEASRVAGLDGAVERVAPALLRVRSLE